MPADEPPESEIVLDSRKAKVVALLIAAPSAALLCYCLYGAARRFDLLPGTFLARWPVAFASGFLLVIPLYFAFKIWRRPTLKNLRRVPFIAAFYCLYGPFLIFELLYPLEWISVEDTEQELLGEVGFLLLLPAYFLVKKAMVLWFKTPELAQSVLQPGSRRVLWGLYCFGLWGVLWQLGQDIPSALGYDDDFRWIESTGWRLIAMLSWIVVVVYVYKKGLRLLGLRPK